MKDLPTGLHTALSAVEVAPVLLVELDWPTGIARSWNGYHDLSWGGNTWYGVGDLGSISEVKESGDGTLNGMSLTLSGVLAANISHAMANNSQGRRARVFFGVLTSTGFSIDPYCVFDGLIDYANIVRDGNTATVTVNLEKELFDDRSNARRWNHEDQQIDFPGDKGFEYVAAIANRQFTWGKATVGGAGGMAGGVDDTLIDPYRNDLS